MIFLRGLAGGASFGWRAAQVALGSGGGRIATGALAGGLAGALGGDNNWAETGIRSATAGALAGAGLGALTTRGGLGALWGVAQVGGRAGRRSIRPGMSVMAGVGNMAMAYPRTTLLAGAGIGAAAMYGPGTHKPINQATLGAAYEGSTMGATDIAPEIATATSYRSSVGFRNSTTGLVQGLHAGRHSGR